MPIKNLTLGLCLLFSGAVEAQSKPYHIKPGDTIESISDRQQVSLRALLSANGLKKQSILRVGRAIVIPSNVVVTHHKHADSAGSETKSVASTQYVVRNGENDWSIAHRNNLSVHSLHLANPHVDWDALRLGTGLVIPHGYVTSKSARTTGAHLTKASSPKLRSYAIKSSDNDWILAHRLGLKTGQLHAINPHVKWDRLRPGQKILVPAGTALGEGRSVARIKSRHAIILSDDVTIRRNASRNAEAITTVDQGTRVTVLDRDGEWYRLRFPKGTEGWVRGDFLKATLVPHHLHDYQAIRSARRHGRSRGRHSTEIVANIPAAGSTLLKTAVSYRGVRYQWGSMSRSGTDCSGFTSQVFGRSGMKLPRTSQEQSSVGQKVDRTSMKPGDLVFFHTTRGRRVSHVGIYMGNGKFIHASSGGGHVQVNSLADGYYHNRFVTARRMAKSKSHAKPKA